VKVEARPRRANARESVMFDAMNALMKRIKCKICISTLSSWTFRDAREAMRVAVVVVVVVVAFNTF
jgi:hypothetical protein